MSGRGYIMVGVVKICTKTLFSPPLTQPPQFQNRVYAHAYLGKHRNGVLSGGDQLTCERQRGSKRHVMHGRGHTKR